MVKTRTEVSKKGYFFANVFGTNERKIKHWKELPKDEEEKVIKLYNALVPSDDKRTIDIEMIVTEAFPKFEETIGEEEFAKVKRFFGISCNCKQKSVAEGEVRRLISRLRTIENAQYYITGYKELIKKMADKLLNSPEGMTDLVKAKLLRMFFVVLNNNEFFLEDYHYRTLPNGRNVLLFSGEQKALDNNKMIFVPEELFTIYDMKVRYSNGYFYDMMVIHFKRMYQEYQMSRNKYKSEIQELLKFAELKYDADTEMFTSVNKAMLGPTFSEIRNLKKRIFEVRGESPLECFCDKKYLEENVDITDLYVIYKIFCTCSLEEVPKTKKRTYRTLSGSRYVDKIQYDYEIFENFSVADDAEIERYIALFEYFAKYDIVVKTMCDGNGGILSNPEYYNVGTLCAAINYAMKVGYLDANTMVVKDFTVAKKMLALEGAEEIFLKFKREEVAVEDMKALLGIDEEFETNVLQIERCNIAEESVNPLINTVIRLALNNGVKSEEDINVDLIENVFIRGNEQNIEKFHKGQIDENELKKRIGFEEEFSESYFDTSKIDINAIEAKLQDIKKYGKKELIHKSKLLISLYCYVVKNGIACGPKTKPAKRNKGLKPEILESLIA